MPALMRIRKNLGGIPIARDEDDTALRQGLLKLPETALPQLYRRAEYRTRVPDTKGSGVEGKDVP